MEKISIKLNCTAKSPSNKNSHWQRIEEKAGQIVRFAVAHKLLSVSHDLIICPFTDAIDPYILFHFINRFVSPIRCWSIYLLVLQWNWNVIAVQEISSSNCLHFYSFIINFRSDFVRLCHFVVFTNIRIHVFTARVGHTVFHAMIFSVFDDDFYFSFYFSNCFFDRQDWFLVMEKYTLSALCLCILSPSAICHFLFVEVHSSVSQRGILNFHRTNE